VPAPCVTPTSNAVPTPAAPIPCAKPKVTPTP
jgi:hypothetical protein